MGLGHSGSGAGTCQADKMFTADVGCKNRCSDRYPGGGTSVQEIISGGLLLFTGGVQDYPDHGKEENRYYDPIPGGKGNAVQVSHCR